MNVSTYLQVAAWWGFFSTGLAIILSKVEDETHRITVNGMLILKLIIGAFLWPLMFLRRVIETSRTFIFEFKRSLRDKQKN